MIRSSLESRIARLESKLKIESKDYPAEALQDLIGIAKAYDQLNDRLSNWFEKYSKISNDLYYSAENVLKNEYSEVPLMFRHTHSVDEELSNESCLRENASAILEQLNDELL